MNRQEFDQLRKRLEQWHADVLCKLTAVERDARGLQQDSPEDIGESSVRSFSKELLFQRATQNRQLLRSLEAAIERIGLGTFGMCVGCGNQIGVKRLEAMPFTAYCRDCQESLERERGSFAENVLQRRRA